MKVSQLSEATGVSVATLKFYLREGLLMSGQATSPTQASYAAEHVDRVRLVRAMLEVGGLSVASARKVVAALESPPEGSVDLLGIAHDALPAPGLDHAETQEVTDLVDRLGWQVAPDTPALRSLAAALEATRRAGVDVPPDRLRRYARACEQVARADVAAVQDAATPAEMLHVVVVGTVMIDPVLSSLRRLAQQHVSCEVFGAPSAPA